MGNGYKLGPQFFNELIEEVWAGHIKACQVDYSVVDKIMEAIKMNSELQDFEVKLSDGSVQSIQADHYTWTDDTVEFYGKRESPPKDQHGVEIADRRLATFPTISVMYVALKGEITYLYG